MTGPPSVLPVRSGSYDRFGYARWADAMKPLSLLLVVAILLTGCAATAVYHTPQGDVVCARPAPNVAQYAGLAAIDMGAAAATAAIAVATVGRVWVWWGASGAGSVGISQLETQRYSAYAECKTALEQAGYHKEVGQ